MREQSPEVINKLGNEKNIWLASVRPDGKPHLVPVWYVWADDLFYICISSKSVKYQNMQQNPMVSLSLENGSHPVICEGEAEQAKKPWPDVVIQEFKDKYDWNIKTDADYDALVAVRPKKWLVW